MKKFYTLFAAMLCAFASLTAQNITVTMDGEKIENGSTVEKYYEEDKTFWGDEPEDYDAGLHPEFMFSSTANGSVDAVVTSLDNSDDVAFCFGSACVMTNASNGYKVTKSGVAYASKKGEVDLQLYVSHTTPWTENYTREIELTITQKLETFTCKIILGVDKEKAQSINGFEASKPVNFANNALAFSLKEDAVVTVYSVTGSDVLSESVEANGSVSLANLPKGIYLYRAQSAGKSYTGKVVVK